MNESILIKIKKALALANSGDTNESQTAMLMAQRLMAKHGIELSEVEEVEEQAKEVVDEQVTNRGRTPFWKKQLASVVAENFRCTNYNSRWGGKSIIRFIGLKEDVEIAKEIYKFAVEVLERTCNAYIKNVVLEQGDADTYGLRNDYRLGFIKGLKEKYTEQVEKMDLAPILVQDMLVVQKVENMGFTKGVSSKVRRSGSQDAYNQGFQTGKSLGSNRLTSR